MRRISMSTAIPGEEASSHTMCELSFDDSDEDDDGEADNSREYLSAEEGYETATDSPETLPPPAEELSTPAEPESRPFAPAQTFIHHDRYCLKYRNQGSAISIGCLDFRLLVSTFYQKRGISAWGSSHFSCLISPQTV